MALKKMTFKLIDLDHLKKHLTDPSSDPVQKNKSSTQTKPSHVNNPQPTSRYFSTGDPLLLHFRQHPYPALNNGHFNPHHTFTYALNAFYGPDIGSFSEWLGFQVKIFKIWVFLVLIFGSFFAIQDMVFSCFDSHP